jgi:hypothetical protein
MLYGFLVTTAWRILPPDTEGTANIFNSGQMKNCINLAAWGLGIGACYEVLLMGSEFCFSCEHGHKTSSFIQSGEILDELSDH